MGRYRDETKDPFNTLGYGHKGKVTRGSRPTRDAPTQLSLSYETVLANEGGTGDFVGPCHAGEVLQQPGFSPVG